MGLLKELFTNCAHPQGRMGRAMLKFMNMCHAPLTNWGTGAGGGELLACFYIAGEQKVADWLARTVMTRMGWFTPPFDTVKTLRQRLEPYYDILDFHVEGAIVYFKVRKR